jgi:hypothetical protein
MDLFLLEFITEFCTRDIRPFNPFELVLTPWDSTERNFGIAVLKKNVLHSLTFFTAYNFELSPKADKFSTAVTFLCYYFVTFT